MTAIIFYNGYTRRADEISAAIEGAHSMIERSGTIKSRIEHAFSTLKVLNMNIESTKSSIDRDIVNKMMYHIITQNPDFFGMCTLWEPQAFDGKDALFANKPGHDSTGRFIPYWSRRPDGSIVVEPLINFDIEGDGDWYLIPKRTKKECLTNPYTYPVGDRQVLMVTVSVPILKDGAFEALTTIDFDLSFVNKDVMKFQRSVYEGNCNIELISANRVFVVNTANQSSVGKPLLKLGIDPDDLRFRALKERMELTEISNDSLVVCSPIYFAKSPTPWLMRVSIPMSYVTQKSSMAEWNSFLVGLLLFIFGLILVWAIATKLTRPLVAINEHINMIAKGDLFQQMKTNRKDEIGEVARALNSMSQKLQEIMLNISESSLVVLKGANQISSTAQIVAEGAALQATGAEEISASIEQIDANIQQNKENAQQTAQLSLYALKEMDSIDHKSKATKKAMEQIVSQIGVINEIAQQTEILSINAGIEASKAGIHGKGFSVVAHEVRKLSDLSKKAAKEINHISQKSMQMADESCQTIHALLPSIKQMTELLDNIVEASTEQALGTAQIHTGVNQLSNIIQQNSIAAEEMNSNSEQLLRQSQELRADIAFFSTSIDNTETEDAAE